MLLTWDSKYSVQVKKIDQQHQQLINIINRLYLAIKSNKVKTEIGRILTELIDYSGYHFSTEERYFTKFNYKNTVHHKKEHQKFTNKMLVLQQQYKNKEIEISFDLIDFLEDWTLEHLMEEDQKYIKCFKDHGLS